MQGAIKRMESQKFGRYEIREELGRGGMATVYHAYDPRFERDVALKVLPREMLHELSFRTRFEREAKTIAMLEHPSIVPVYDFGEEEGQPYFVMRYMTGGSLADRMKKGPISLQDMAHIMSLIAPALDDAHKKGIIHRDLKPGNILFDQFNEPYIADFGIAKLTDSQSNVTGSAIVGTPAYMSPEQAQGEGIDGRSDIYGLGVILFETLTGQQPYHGDTPMSVVVKHITDPVPHILDVKPDLPADLEGVIEKAMAKDRNERYQDVKSLAEALNSVARGESLVQGGGDATAVATSKATVATKRPIQSLEGTVVSKPVSQGAVAQPVQPVTPVPQAGAPRSRTGLWIGLGVVVLFVLIAIIGGLLVFKDRIPFLAAPVPTQTQAPARPSPTAQTLPPTATTAPVVIPVATDTPAVTDTPAPSPTATVASLPTLGGADKIAFLSNRDIWMMNVDGSDLTQLTKDTAEKHGLQWAPDGQSIFYISGKCIQNVTIQNPAVSTVTCFNAADYFDAFEISPDGSMVAISLNHYLYIVPFDLNAISAVTSWGQLIDMKGVIFTYNPKLGGQVALKGVRWSADGKMIAADVLTPSSGQFLDVIVLYNISSCNTDSPCNSTIFPSDNFPASRFDMQGYGIGSGKSSIIPSFSWDGTSLFLLNSIIRNGNYGYLYSYNTSNKKGEKLDPIGTTCCYTDAIWSPDGAYFLFAYQNITLGSTSRNQLYFISYGSLGTGAKYTPIPLPDNIFTNIGEHPDPILRSAK